MTDVDLTCLSLFSGVGMLDVGWKIACEHHGWRTRTVAYVEREAYAAACLMARMEELALEPAPIWCGDLRELDRDLLRFPCQDISLAGSGEGIRGARSGLWFDMLDLARDLGAQWLALENVAAITVRGLDAVLGSLAESGWDAEWTCLRASDVGASHRRDRWFCVANRSGDGRGEGRTESTGQQGRQDAAERGEPMGHADGERPKGLPAGDGSLATETSIEPVGDSHGANGRKRVAGQRSQRGTAARRASRTVGDTAESRQQGLDVGATDAQQPAAKRAGCDVGDSRRGRRQAGNDGVQQESASEGSDDTPSRRGDLSIFAPGPGVHWHDIIERMPHLAPAINASEAKAQSVFRELADGLARPLDHDRASALRAGGNGVVPLQAAVAFALLIGRLTS